MASKRRIPPCDRCSRLANVMMPNLNLCDVCFNAIDSGSAMALVYLRDQWTMPPADVPVFSER